VQVVALEWNWLFIYPDYNIATLNFMNIPKETPINLEITADSPMNSFWVPALAGQVYAMNGMTTKLHIMADKVGSYNGSSANISGEGYADMRFKVNSKTDADFTTWTKEATLSRNELSTATYGKVAAPTIKAAPTTYKLQSPNLFNDVILKYMPEKTEAHGGSH
jgi:cytochrome o ubiquinol oxidase subunit 2